MYTLTPQQYFLWGCVMFSSSDSALSALYYCERVRFTTASTFIHAPRAHFSSFGFDRSCWNSHRLASLYLPACRRRKRFFVARRLRLHNCTHVPPLSLAADCVFLPHTHIHNSNKTKSLWLQVEHILLFFSANPAVHLLFLRFWYAFFARYYYFVFGINLDN